jgi:GntR family transcriptional regulator
MIEESKLVYIRLREVISSSILDGTYGDGDMLPSVRAFAAEQKANPLTVAKAYQSFQEDGLVTVRRGVGMFVADGAAKRLREMERGIFMDHIWPRVATRMRMLGIKYETLDPMATLKEEHLRQEKEFLEPEAKV